MPQGSTISSSSCRAASTDIPDPLSPLLRHSSLLAGHQSYILYPHSWTLTKLKLKVKEGFFTRTHGKQHDGREGIRMRNA